ncbi:MAG TPA: WG repeat-containing protein, partial [Saprospiraceae bacterium]|nr:WG repeat-containing protein [Saprospiraceae bacterium]
YQEIGSNYLALEDEKGWSIFDYSGEIIHDYNFENVYPKQMGRQGNQFYLITNNSKYGLINTKGEIVLVPKYDSIKEQSENFYMLSKDWYWSSEALFMVTLGMEYFYVNKDGNEYRCND